jgi:hypothetical protein
MTTELNHIQHMIFEAVKNGKAVPVIATEQLRSEYRLNNTPFVIFSVEHAGILWYGCKEIDTDTVIKSPERMDDEILREWISRLTVESWMLTVAQFGFAAENDWPIVCPSKGRVYGTMAQVEYKKERGNYAGTFSSISSAQNWLTKTHAKIIRLAVKSGLAVPARVLAEYPRYAK